MPRTDARMTAWRLVLCAVLSAGICHSAMAQEGTVGGTVVDETGQPLFAVQVIVEGTIISTSTDATGRFTIRAFPAPNGMLRFIRIGYRATSKRVERGQTDIQVVLSQVAVNIDEVVVTGTAGATGKRELGNTVTSITGSEVVEIARIPDVAAMITGRAPGVEVRATSSQVGAGPNIRIRGASTFSLNHQPLIYIDGVRVDNSINSGIAVGGSGSGIFSRINDISPEEIETIEIIKGPAAATLYGTEASKGVIQIVTKRGRATAPQWSISVRQGGWAFRNPEGRIAKNWGRPLSNMGQVRSDTTIPYPAGDEPFEFDIFANEASLGNKIFETGYGQGYNLSVAGGIPTVRYFLDAGFDRDHGIEPMNFARKFNGRVNLSVTPTPKLDLTTNVGYVNGKTNIAHENGGLWFDLIFANPSADNPGPTAPRGITGPRRGFNLFPTELQYRNREIYQVLKKQTMSITLNHRPTSYFSWRLTAGQDQSSTQDVQFRANTPELAPFQGANAALGFRFVGNSNVETTTIDGSGDLVFPLSKSVTSKTTVGTQYYHRFLSLQSATGNRFSAPGLEVVAAAAERLGTEDFIENNTLGVFGQQQFSLNGRLFLTGAVRIDDNSAFGRDFNFSTYPKASLSWVLSEEPFFKLGFVDVFKFRAAYGAAGQQPAAFAALRTLTPVAAGVGGVLVPLSLGNNQLKPERGTELEAGFEAGLFNSRVGIDFTLYRSRTRDAILSRQVAPSLGFSGDQFVNAGTIQNQGVELQVRTIAIQKANIGLDFMLNLSTNDNQVISLGGIDQGNGFLIGSQPDGSETFQRHVPGFPVGSWFWQVAVSADIARDGGAINVMCDGGNPNGRKLPDGTPLEMGGPPVPCDQAPMVYLGRPIPKFEGSFGSTITLFRHLRLNGLADWRSGWVKFDVNLWGRCAVFLMCEASYFPERVKEAPPYFRNRSGPAYIAEIQSGGAFLSHAINDATFLRLREISAAFDFPRRWARWFGAKTATLSLAARNLYHWSGYTGLDPEAQFTTPTGTEGIEQVHPPPLLSYMATMRLTF